MRIILRVALLKSITHEFTKFADRVAWLILSQSVVLKCPCGHILHSNNDSFRGDWDSSIFTDKDPLPFPEGVESLTSNIVNGH